MSRQHDKGLKLENIVLGIIASTFMLFTACGGDDNNGKSSDDTSSDTGDDEKDDSDNDNSSKDSLCEDFIHAFQECGVFTDGDVSCGMLVDYTSCQIECFIDADCGDLESYACDDEEPDCVEECADAEFTCEDGDTVPADYECDGEEDCEDGSDEHDDCPVFECESGDEEIPGAYECDFEEDCEDGSDEHDGCATMECK